MRCCQSFYWDWTIRWTKRFVLRAQLVKWLLNLHCWKGTELLEVAALWTILAHENGQQWKGDIQLTSFFLFRGKSCLECHPPSRGDCNTGQWETHLQWETKRFALLTSCWLPVELHLVVVAFGFAVACHQMALGWWIHFQGNYIGTFWQWHLPNAWKQ